MLLVWCGVVWILSNDVHLCKLFGRIFWEKWKIKSDIHWVTKRTQRYDEKLRYQVLPMIQRKSGMVPRIPEKERKLSLILTSETQKFWVPYMGFFNNSLNKESSVARLGEPSNKLKNLESLGWGEHNQKNLPQNLKKLTDFLKQRFPQCCFLKMLSVNRDPEKSRADLLVYVRLKPGILCAPN